MMKKFFKPKPSTSLTPESLLEPMSNHKLDGLLRQISADVQGEAGYWQLIIEGRDLLVMTDTAHNRMRIMSPIADQKSLESGEYVRLLEANFASALDVKYALKDGTLWSVFTHPLAQLTDEQVMDCAAQVINLANNFGGSYASSNLIFGGG